MYPEEAVLLLEEIQFSTSARQQNIAKLENIKTLKFLYDLFAIVKCDPEQVGSDLKSRLEQALQGVNWNSSVTTDVDSEYYNPQFDDDLPDFVAMNKLKSKLRGDEM